MPKPGKISLIFQIFEVIAPIGKNLGAEKILTKLTLLAIKSYQSYISPHKGFSCAYRQLYGEQSCSGYFYTCILDTNLSTASRLIQQRLINCQQAYTVLQSNKQSNNHQKRYQHKNSGECNNCQDWIDLGSCLYVCDPIDCVDCGDCDVCDLGSCDF